MLLSELWAKYQQDKKIEGYSPLTLKTYCFQYNLLLRFIGDMDMSELTTEKLKNLRYIIKRISNRAGIKKSIHPHQLRHSYATHMINNGAPLEVIQSLLGHEKSETTKIYAQLSGKLRHDFYSKYF